MRILVATGASGGHIFPSLAFIEALQLAYKDAEIILVLPEGNKLKEPLRVYCKIAYISIEPLKTGLGIENLRSALKIGKGIFESLAILLKFKPDLAVGFGSIATLPVMLGAWLLRIKTVIHEQNVVPGRANKVLSKFVDKIAVSFEDTKNLLPCAEEKVVLTGNPLRRSLVVLEKKEALRFFGFSDEKRTILVCGGSQGSHKINTEFVKALDLLKEKDGFQVVHLCGQADFSFIQKEYSRLHNKVALYNFFDTMQYAYSAADLVVSRAGATTISEIIFFKLPAILIPYPYAQRHQYLNAKVLEEKGCGIIINEERFTADVLKEALTLLLKSKDKLENMRRAYTEINTSAASDVLVQEALALN